MSNLCMAGGGQYVDRSEVAMIPTPKGTNSWRPVPHIEVIDAVTEVVKAHRWEITEEQFGLAREGQKLFGVMKINKTSCAEWTRCIGLRNSHDKSFSVGLSAGINVLVCSNMAFGGSTVIKRRHTSRIELTELVGSAKASWVGFLNSLKTGRISELLIAPSSAALTIRLLASSSFFK